MQPTKRSESTATQSSRRTRPLSTNLSMSPRDTEQVDEYFRPHFQALENLRTEVESQQSLENDRIQQDLIRRNQQMQEREQIFEQRLAQRQNNIESSQIEAQRRFEGIRQQNRRELEEKKQALQNVQARAEQLAQIRLAAQHAREQQSTRSSQGQDSPKETRNTDKSSFSEEDNADPACVIS